MSLSQEMLFIACLPDIKIPLIWLAILRTDCILLLPAGLEQWQQMPGRDLETLAFLSSESFVTARYQIDALIMITGTIIIIISIVNIYY